MKHHKYYNTIWSERDGEFYWDGLKLGFVFGGILIPCLIGDGIMFVNWFRHEVLN